MKHCTSARFVWRYPSGDAREYEWLIRLESPQGYRQSCLRSFIVFLSPSRLTGDVVRREDAGSLRDRKACTEFIRLRITERWWAVVKTEMNLRFYKMLGINDQLKNCQLLKNNLAFCCIVEIVIDFLITVKSIWNILYQISITHSWFSHIPFGFINLFTCQLCNLMFRRLWFQLSARKAVIPTHVLLGFLLSIHADDSIVPETRIDASFS